ncbi:MAG: helix-turn-helix domain-containing protein [Saccharofermentans sp.]|nr:helix-turn-helix domain-containing protein [Saccharofermentans sp.]
MTPDNDYRYGTDDAMPDSEIKAIVASNLKNLIKQNKTTQKELALKTDITPATMSDYCKEARIPSVSFLVRLKKLYGIDIDEFLTKRTGDANRPYVEISRPSDMDSGTTYEKYCGIYMIYYFDTGRYKGSDSEPPKESVKYGILYLYKDGYGLGGPEYKCAAALSIEDRGKAYLIMKELEYNSSSVIDYLARECRGNLYQGSFELSPEHAFVTLSHGNTDRALLIFHRVDSNKDFYLGGIGTINSVSKGRERAPVVQYVGISRTPLTMSAEEIHHNLLLSRPVISAEEETEELIRNFKMLYSDSEDTPNELSEYQKSIIIRSLLERYIRKSLERNMFRYGKVSERDDDEWYQMIKESFEKNSRT